MASKPIERFTPDEYLAMERAAQHKSEYFDGEVVAMVGASEPHNLIVTNIVGELSVQLRGRPCRVYASDMRVDVRESGLYAYPDVVALSGEPILSDDERDNLRNPAAIIEVLSKSTEGYDRGRKFMKYRRIESLLEYVLVAQDKTHVEHYVRQQNGGWLLMEATTLDDEIHLASINCQLKLSVIYDKVSIRESE
jgi:Uma2 family endonuclease